MILPDSSQDCPVRAIVLLTEMGNVVTVRQGGGDQDVALPLLRETISRVQYLADRQ